jgi:hypothetical protein
VLGTHHEPGPPHGAPHRGDLAAVIDFLGQTTTTAAAIGAAMLLLLLLNIPLISNMKLLSCMSVFNPSNSRHIFFEVDEDDILKTFMSLRKRRIKHSEK